MTFFQKTLLTVLPCMMLNLIPSTASAADNLTDLMNSLAAQQAGFSQVQTANPSLQEPSAPSQALSTNSSATMNLISTAKNFIGLPYRFGGTSPTSGFDCSGFMQYVYKETANINLPRTSSSMAQVGEKVSRDELQPGDMVFFSHSGGRISHVGMYIGEGRFIHSPSTGKSISITALNSGYWANKFVTARRVISA